MAQPSSEKYFFGRIAREQAEKVLKDTGLHEGLFLLRESMSVFGNYVLSIVHEGRIHHYCIERQSDGTVMIQDGKKFPGPIELIRHHTNNLDGLLTKPVRPCVREKGTSPMAWPGVTYLDLDQMIIAKAKEKNLKGTQLETCLGPQRAKFVMSIAKELHQEQPWYHGKIDRNEADNVMMQSGHHDGKFLVRDRDQKTYALSLSYKKVTKHYKIEKLMINGEEKYAIEDGPRFTSLMDMVAHYHNKPDGLLCKLTKDCVCKNYNKRTKLEPDSQKNVAYGLFTGDLQAEDDVGATGGTPPPGVHNGIGSRRSQQGLMGSAMVKDTTWDEPEDISDAQRRPNLPPRPLSTISTDDESQKIYDSVPHTEEVFNLDKRDLEIKEKLGAGNFGSVLRGNYRRAGRVIPVAIKTLKKEELESGESGIMIEAKLMAGLKHRNIVRMIGVCKSAGESIMLVLELASLGPLHKYLHSHTEMSMSKVTELMCQVADGMAYLESNNFVHRDLAARNVLLVSESFAKISDFGMSRALGLDSDYYTAKTAGKWPLKWYAPECIYYFKFDSSSDVWSYGITLWEATSYGEKPYKGLRGSEILSQIERGRRLLKPPKCPSAVYAIMERCWQFK
ncbi:hypothetical protein NP493_1062g00054 [Ridgeia piscesae]|uniref:Tyrosine-protein kinase n=1 Tax=Ridgeia piscesae TaxID=27915 RepID=A0AAD9KHI5_RIDPI|nr:hypothetical protein NP493_1062g00054 [Ridgeia piscesae]